MTNRREILRAGLAGAGLSFIPGSLSGLLTLSDTGTAQAAQVKGGHLVVALVPEPQHLTGGIAVSNPAIIISANVFDGLVTYDENFKPVPQLAESWSESDGGKTITFNLRRDVKWHDGTPFTSADVQYSLLEVVKKVHPRGGATFAKLETVETPDPHTAVLRLSAPAPVIWSALHGTETQIVAKHLYAGTDPLTNPWNAKPVGTGAYRFKEWIKGDRIVLERNPDYWRPGLPLADRITFRIIPDASARAAALETGEVHYAPLSPIPLSEVERAKAQPGLVVESRGWEANAPVYFFDFNLRKKVFQDIRVRQAFAHAIDRKALAETVWYGFATPATGPVPSFQKQFYTADTPQFAYDPKKAEALLEEAGLKRGADGVRLKINHLPIPYGDDFKRSGEFIRQQLKRVGIEVELQNYDVPTFLRKVYTEREFDTLSAYYAAFADPQIGVQRRFWSQAIKPGSPWSNASGYATPDMDRVIEAIQSEADVDKRNALIRQLQVIAQSDLPSISLLELKFFRVHSAKLKGINVGPVGIYEPLSDVWVES